MSKENVIIPPNLLSSGSTESSSSERIRIFPSGALLGCSEELPPPTPKPGPPKSELGEPMSESSPVGWLLSNTITLAGMKAPCFPPFSFLSANTVIPRPNSVTISPAWNSSKLTEIANDAPRPSSPMIKRSKKTFIFQF
jgi:hypothetical protein